MKKILAVLTIVLSFGASVTLASTVSQQTPTTEYDSTIFNTQNYRTQTYNTNTYKETDTRLTVGNAACYIQHTGTNRVTVVYLTKIPGAITTDYTRLTSESNPTLCTLQTLSH